MGANYNFDEYLKDRTDSNSIYALIRIMLDSLEFTSGILVYPLVPVRGGHCAASFVLLNRRGGYILLTQTDPS